MILFKDILTLLILFLKFKNKELNFEITTPTAKPKKGQIFLNLNLHFSFDVL
jgi:hypothetical protein